MIDQRTANITAVIKKREITGKVDKDMLSDDSDVQGFRTNYEIINIIKDK